MRIHKKIIMKGYKTLTINKTKNKCVNKLKNKNYKMININWFGQILH
jgi:hypothetical protein